MTSAEGKEMKVKRFWKLLSLMVLGFTALGNVYAQDLSAAVRRGQSATLAPNGTILLAGGSNPQSGPTAEAFLSVPNEPLKKLASGLNVARAGHTATVLPDGTVFIFGGVGADGKIVSVAELFDPITEKFSVLADVLAVPRAYHTATLLTDGRLLLAGGIEASGDFPEDVQLWDFRTRNALSQSVLLMTRRQGHTATLLADGAVRVSGGTDPFGRPVLVDEIYDPSTQRFRFANQSEMVSGQPGEPLDNLRIAESIPVDGAADAPIDSLISLRFTRLLNTGTVNGDHFVLIAPDGKPVEAKITAAESGRLVFAMPSSPLEPGTTYTLRIHGAADPRGAELAETSISFTTAGEPPQGTGSDWVPNASWTAPDGTTQFQSLPPLQAAHGATALAGQVLKLNGWPLEHVTLEMDGKRVETDHTGRFLLRGLTAGHHVLWIDGTTANRSEASYGVYEVGVTILPNKTNILNYTIWMTRLDTAHAIDIPSPTRTEMVITNPNLPGLELHLPANTVITDRYGKVVHQVGITAIPLNKTPFPLPAGVQVPIYFTVQPGGAYIKVLGAGGPKGARLVYPNAFHLNPGMAFDFWNYDAAVKGWFIYGTGHVSADARQVIPDPGVVIYELTGAMVGSGGAGQQACMAGWRNLWGLLCPTAGDPVSLTSGEFTNEKTDLVLSGILPMSLTRTYHSADSFSRSFGIGTTNGYDMFMVGDVNPYTYQELVMPDGARVRFDRISSGTSYLGAVYVHTSSMSPFYGALLTFDQPSDTWKITLKDGTVYTFPDSFQSTNPYCQALSQITDRYGNTLNMARAPKTGAATDCELMGISSSTAADGRFINFSHDGQGRITQAQDNMGRTVSYTYDSAGRLSTVTDVGGGVTTYTYDDQNRMLTIQDARGIVYLTNQYDSSGRVIRQTQADTGTYLFTWTGSGNTFQSRSMGGTVVTNGSSFLTSGCWNGSSFNRYSSACAEGYLPLVTQVDVTDPRGYVREVKFNSAGYMTSDTHALGQPEQQTVTYAYYADNTSQSVTDTLGRVSSFDYDALGNPVRATRLSGTSNAVTTTFVYGGAFNGLTSVTDPLNHTSTFTYDAQGNRITASDALQHHTTFAYNPVGQVTAVTDALSNSAVFSYFGSDLVSVTDPLGNISSQFVDGAGRVQSTTDAMGHTTKMQYDVLNQVTQVTDPAGKVSNYTYDANGNPLSLTDALGHITSYTYDSMDRRATRTDPLLRQESYGYDLNGNLASATDRKGQVTAFSYDGLNRPTSTCFGQTVSGGVTSCASTISYQYDLPNRRTIITDSLAGTITRTYDDLGRLISEVTPQGSMSYAYDAASRLTSSTVAGQPQATYAYDFANRLTTVTKGTQSVQFSYDSGSRLSSMTLPNGIVAAYGYDVASRLTSISYSLNQVSIGTLNYTYDALNRRIGVSGTLARTGLPGAITSASYDAANQVATWNGTTFSYDSDGNLLSDGAYAYTWDARGQLAGISGAATAGFAYDALGRRISKTLGANNTGFLYNGGAITQELSGSTVTANVWNGGTSYFQRTDANGSVVPLVDAMGSVVALADANGNITSQYTYDPFGGTTASGATSANPFQYIGQENDLTGLYYFHARYYSPALHRFISEDPLGFAGGDVNLHAYGFSSPTNFRDPSGKTPLVACVAGGAINTGMNVIADKITGRKVTWGNAFDYFGSGCGWGVGFEITGINWAIGKLVTGLVKVATPMAASILDREIAETVSELCAFCFPAGTPVMTRNGPVPIERIKVGDEVLSRNRDTGKLEYKRVAALARPHLSKVLEIHIAAEANALHPTPEHPFFVRRAGGSQADWVRAAEMQIGDSVLTSSGLWTEVLAISLVDKEQIVYNFEVAENHDYFVGAAELLVHNGCGDAAQKIAQDIASGFGPGECAACANAVADALTSAGINGERVVLSTQGLADYIYSDVAAQSGVGITAPGIISTNGVHTAVQVGDMVFDNINPGGILRSAWEKSLLTRLGSFAESFTVTSYPF